MEARSLRFLTQFSHAVFHQWTLSPENEKFWEDGASMHAILEEAVAKLPNGKLKTQLVRDLVPLETQLITLLSDLHATYILKHQTDTNYLSGALLNEVTTEKELTLTDAAFSIDKQSKLSGVLALDTGIDIASHEKGSQNDDVEQLVQLFGLIPARAYEAPKEQQHKRGLVLRRLTARVQQQMETLPSNWRCSKDADASKQVQHLRILLERIVVQDVVALAQNCRAQQSQNVLTGGLKAPWTSFYRPEESKELRQVNFEEEMAKVFGALLTLAIYYPIDHNIYEKETSNESSEEEEETSEQSLHNKNSLSVAAQAQATTRQVLLAAQMRQRGLCQNGQWLVLVLSFLHSLAKPVTYHDEDGDEVIDEQDLNVLLDCLGQVYSSAFASVTLFDQAKEGVTEVKIAEQDRALFNAVVCLRHAAHFMRVKRKSSSSSITTAMAHLAGVPLPASFVSWLDHQRVANSTFATKEATQRLWKKCIGQNWMLNILLNSTEVTSEQLLLMQESYSKYLNEVTEGALNKPKSQVKLSSSFHAANEAAVNAESLFYVDNAGGKDEEETTKSKKKRANKKKKKRVNKSITLTSSKRSRALSN